VITSGVNVAVAVEALHQAYLALRKEVGATTDAVVHGPSSTTYLLPEMQMELHRMARTDRDLAVERAAILDAIPAHLAILDEAGTIVAVNQAWRLFTHAQNFQDQTAAIGGNYLQICRAVTGNDEEIATAVAIGLEQILAGKIEQVTLEYPCQTPEKLLWFSLVIVPLQGMKRMGAVMMHLDITERRAGETREAELKGRIERLMDQAGIGILVHQDNLPVFVNPALVKMLGLEGQDDILGLDDVRSLFDLPLGTELGSLDADLGMPETIRSTIPVAGRRKDGRPVMLSTIVFTMTWGAEPAVCVMLTDITDLLRVEDKLRAAQKLQAVGRLTGGIAHDFNNLLTVILGNGDMLVEALQHQPHLAQLAEQLVMVAERGAELTKRLLAFARLQPLNPLSTNVNQRLAAIEDVLRRTLGAAIAIKLDLADDLWPAMIDSGELDNAILNLSINARDAMPEGGRLTIRTSNMELDEHTIDVGREVLPGSYVLVTVADNGTGMSDSTLERVFEPFFTTKDVGKGSGLGLSMVFGFVKQSQGHIQIRSAPSQGTSVEIYLPRASGPAPVVSSAAGRGALDAASGKGAAAVQYTERILMVEDDATLRAMVEGQLRRLGYHVVTASTGLEAIAILQTNAVIDLLFTDVSMPGGLDGIMLAKMAALQRPTLPVLFASGFAEGVSKAQWVDESDFLLLEKPYRTEKLALMIRLALDHNRLNISDAEPS